MILSFVLTAAAVLTPSPTYASPSDPVVTPQEDADCHTWLAGVVNNESTFWMQIKGNLVEGGPTDIVFQLAPGENSEEDTAMCDVDYVNVQQPAWWLWHWRNQDSWVDINFFNITCRDRWWFGNKYVHCTALWAAPPDGPPEPPIPTPGPDEPQPGDPRFPWPPPSEVDQPDQPE